MIINKTETGFEPVSRSDVKEYLQISDTSEDSLIDKLIVRSRQWAEIMCGISIIQKTIVLEDYGIWFPYMVPYGPVQSISVLKIDNTDFLSDDNVYRAGYLYLPDELIEGEQYKLQMTYVAGFSYVPEDLKYLIMDAFKLFFDGRGANIEPSSAMKQTLHDYNRNLFI